MKGQQIIEFIVQAELPDTEQVREKCLAQAAAEKRRAKRPLVLAGVTLAAAAVLAVCFIFGNSLFTPKPENSFSLTAYALEQQEDGSFTVSDTYINDLGRLIGPGISGSYVDGTTYYYQGIFLNIEGANIQSVRFFAADDEDYAKTHTPAECGEINFAKTYTEIENDVAVINFEDIYDTYGNYSYTLTKTLNIAPLQHLGSNFTMTADELTEDLLLYVGRVRLRGYVSPNLNITVHAVATFTDGATQEETFFVQ